MARPIWAEGQFGTWARLGSWPFWAQACLFGLPVRPNLRHGPWLQGLGPLAPERMCPSLKAQGPWAWAHGLRPLATFCFVGLATSCFNGFGPSLFYRHLPGLTLFAFASVYFWALAPVILFGFAPRCVLGNCPRIFCWQLASAYFQDRLF